MQVTWEGTRQSAIEIENEKKFGNKNPQPEVLSVTCRIFVVRWKSDRTKFELEKAWFFGIRMWMGWNESVKKNNRRYIELRGRWTHLAHWVERSLESCVRRRAIIGRWPGRGRQLCFKDRRCWTRGFHWSGIVRAIRMGIRVRGGNTLLLLL